MPALLRAFAFEASVRGADMATCGLVSGVDVRPERGSIGAWSGGVIGNREGPLLEPGSGGGRVPREGPSEPGQDPEAGAVTCSEARRGWAPCPACCGSQGHLVGS